MYDHSPKTRRSSNTYITKQPSNSPIIGIEALLGLADLKVRLKAGLQGEFSLLDKNKNKEDKEDKDKEGELCLTEAPPRADNQREDENLAAITGGESRTSTVADQSTTGTVLDGYSSTQNNSTAGGSS